MVPRAWGPPPAAAAAAISISYLLLLIVSGGEASGGGGGATAAGRRLAGDPQTRLFLHKLFVKYGRKGRISFEGFEHLLQSLGIGKVSILDHDIHDHHNNGSFVDFHRHHRHHQAPPPPGNHSIHHPHPDRPHPDRPHPDHPHPDHPHPDHPHPDHPHLDHPHPDRPHPDHPHPDHPHPDHPHPDHPHPDRPHPDHPHRNHGDSQGTSHELDRQNTGQGHLKRGRHRGHHEHEADTHRDEARPSVPPTGRPRHQQPGGHPDVTPEVPTAATSLPGGRRRRALSRDDEAEHHVDDGMEEEEEKEEEEGGLEPLVDKCMSAGDILRAFHVNHESGISEQTFVSLCPAIVYQIDRHACPRPQHPHQHPVTTSNGSSALFDPKVWGYAITAVTVISLVGLLCVAMVPILQKAFYNHLLQFLIALAVGSLTGDAFLHLIPHALGGGHSDGEDDHDDHDNDAIWKGLLVLGGLYLFFVLERLMAGYQQWRRQTRKVKLRKKTSERRPRRPSWRFSAIGQKLCEYDKVAFSSENMGAAPPHDMCTESLELKRINDVEESQNEDRGQGHSGMKGHGHGHSHGPLPSSVASMAWMVIMGDGLHNFSDGLAIGAGFANSLTAGLSTSVAVFCHELPHELGDFAVLLQSGMTVRQALFYNLVSSVLCFLGMAIGVAVGNIGSASLWIFAMTAGTFVYISLADMLPELSTEGAASVSSQLCFLLLHVVGLGAGLAIMLVIALYEHKIKVEVDTTT